VAYVTAAEMRAFLDITSTADDAIFTALIAAASRTVNAITHRTFEASANTTRKFTPLVRQDGGNLIGDARTLMFDEDLCSLTSIVNGDGSVIASTEYFLIAPNSTTWYGVTLKSQSSITWTYTGSPELSVEITGKWSYSETCPADIAQAVKMIVKHFYTARAVGNDSDRDVLSADGVVIAASRIPSAVHKILGAYVKYS
jgi:hypothetical protein